jgi:opacity protein-like surface antigen
MKKIIVFTAAMVIAASSILFAQTLEDNKIVVQREKNVFVNPSDNEFIWKIGTGYASDPGKFGLDLSFNYIYNIDPFFVFGLEADFFWIKWSSTVGEVNPGGSVTASEKADTNLYTFPLFANAQVRLPMLKKLLYVEPFFTIGLGYSFMILDYSSDEGDGTDFYSGFAWQIMTSAAYKISDASAVDFVFDLGYRSIKPDKGNVEIDMSGAFFRAGVRFYI